MNKYILIKGGVPLAKCRAYDEEMAKILFTEMAWDFVTGEKRWSINAKNIKILMITGLEEPNQRHYLRYWKDKI